jgi:hypothetical protein
MTSASGNTVSGFASDMRGYYMESGAFRRICMF